MTLDRNPTNYFAEIEQLAFAPSHMIPGKPFDTQESFLYVYYHIFSYLIVLYFLLSKFVRKEILLTRSSSTEHLTVEEKFDYQAE